VDPPTESLETGIHKVKPATTVQKATLASGIDIGQGINLGPRKFGKSMLAPQLWGKTTELMQQPYL
jgi:hypothetical protein